MTNRFGGYCRVSRQALVAMVRRHATPIRFFIMSRRRSLAWGEMNKGYNHV
jgi:hypothetical protein